jgi:catechol 1,2-dioxygenase
MERRNFIKNSTLTVLSISAFGSISWNGKSFEGDTPTTTDILGPFYRPGAPIRTNLRLASSTGTPILLKGIIFKEDGKTPVNDALVEIWHCDEHEVYDNASDEYNYRGGQKTKADGKYEFKSILPVPYKANPTNEASYRPAHIHMRVSVPNQQDLVTQLYFKGGKYVDTDNFASAPQAVDRILDVTTDTRTGESLIVFHVTMSKEIPLDTAVYKKITGLYRMEDDSKVEFIKKDDLLFMKRNGQLVVSLKYMGNNTFEGGIGFPKVRFELLPDGGSKAVIINQTKTNSGLKYLKYGE